VVSFLFIAVAVVYSQNRELLRTGLALSADPLLVIENDARVTGVSQQTLGDELARVPAVVSSTLMVTPPWTNPCCVLPFQTERANGAPLSTALMYMVGDDFLRTLDIPLIAGRDFDARRAQDVAAVAGPPTGTQSVVISRALAAELGAAPEEM